MNELDQKKLRNVLSRVKSLESEIREGYESILMEMPIKYKPRQSEGRAISFSNYSWGNIPLDLIVCKDELVQKYEMWYSLLFPIVNEYFPHKIDDFKKIYKGNYRKPGMLEILQFRYHIRENNRQNILSEFNDLFVLQALMVSNLELFLDDEELKENDNVERLGTIENLEKDLILAIYDHILKNPKINKEESRYIPPVRKETVKKNHKNQCQLCGNIFSSDDLQVDHIFPHAYGGSNDILNLMPLCKPCNLDKGKRLDYYRSDEGREKIKENITRFVRGIPIISNFGKWLEDQLDQE